MEELSFNKSIQQEHGLPKLLPALAVCTSSTISEKPPGVVVEAVSRELANEKQGLL